jgi:hypothetical protein
MTQWILSRMDQMILMRTQEKAANLPDAPQIQDQTQKANSGSGTDIPLTPAGEALTRQQAEQLALKNNPRDPVGIASSAEWQFDASRRRGRKPHFSGIAYCISTPLSRGWSHSVRGQRHGKKVAGDHQ